MSASTVRHPMRAVLSTLSYEILPFTNTQDLVLSHVPTSVPLTVTTTQSRGLERTIALTERLAGHGYGVAPHLAARLVRDDQHLADLVARLDAAGVRSVFVVGGDAPEPDGCFPDALSLLEALETAGHRFASVGVAGYPEGHSGIASDILDRALLDKMHHAAYVVTQLCFDAAVTTRWAERVAREGVHLPVYVGLPGSVTRQKLVRISAGLGLGQSARFLRKQQNLLWRFFLPGGYRPDKLVDRLAPQLGARTNEIAGFHLFTFNELERTEAWRQSLLERIEASR